MAREDNYAMGLSGRKRFDFPEVSYFEIYSTSCFVGFKVFLLVNEEYTFRLFNKICVELMEEIIKTAKKCLLK